MAKFLPVSEFGLYGLLTVSIGYLVYFVGFDFYNFSSRELVSLGREKWGGIFKAQGMLTLFLYLVFIPLSSVLFILGFLPAYLFLWFVFLLLVEHICQEITRVLIVASYHLAASILIFLRTGVWALVCAIAMVVFPQARVLEFVLGCWLVGGIIGCTIGIAWLLRLNIGGWASRVDIKIIKRGVKVALPLLVSTLAMRAIFTVDRYMVEAYGGAQILAAYVLFSGIVTTLMSLLDAGIFYPAYPKLIKYYDQNKVLEFIKTFKKIFGMVVVTAFAFLVFSGIAIEYVLQWVGKPLFLERLEMFYWILGAIVIYSLSMVPHYGLYAQHRDAMIIWCHCLSLVVFISSGVFFAGSGGDFSIPKALCATFSFMLLWKMSFFVTSYLSWVKLVKKNG